MSSFSVGDKRRKPIFIHSELDDYGLDPYEFRVYARFARRTGNTGQMYESVGNVAKACKMSERKVQHCIKVLLALRLIDLAKADKGETRHYDLLDIEAWVDVSEVEATREAALKPTRTKDTPAPHAEGGAPHAEGVRTTCTPTPAPHAPKGYPFEVDSLEGYPPKESANADAPLFVEDETHHNGELSTPQAELLDATSPDLWWQTYNRLKHPRMQAATKMTKACIRPWRSLMKEHGADEALAIFEDAVRDVSADSFYADKGYSMKNVLVNAEERANQWRHKQKQGGGGQVARDALRFYEALKGRAVHHA